MISGLKAVNSAREFQWGSWQIIGPRHYFREKMILNTILKKLKGGKILDVGCGTGSLLSQLAQHGYQVNGVDMSQECVSRTNELLSAFASATRSFVKKGSAEHIDYPDGIFDAVIAAEVLEHLEDDSSAVKEFHRLLKSDGICLITVPANPDLWDISDDIAGHKRRYNKEDLIRLFNKMSFNVESVFYWGFPLLRFYHRFIFLKLARHVSEKRNGTMSTEDTVVRVGFSRWTTAILGNLFRFDNLFKSLPLGIGILLVARKREKGQA